MGVEWLRETLRRLTGELAGPSRANYNKILLFLGTGKVLLQCPIRDLLPQHPGRDRERTKLADKIRKEVTGEGEEERERWGKVRI